MAKRTVAGEQYFTPPHLAQNCLDLVGKHYRIDEFSLVVEPSAGTGVFFDRLPPANRIGIDIDPKHDGLLSADFLTWHPEPGQRKVLTIGNPPFGQRAAIAVDFLQHAATFSDVVAFILPRSFRKYTFQNRVPRYFHLVDWFDCREFSRPDGTTVEVNAVFQIWEKRPSPRGYIALRDTHPHFEMKHAHLSRTSEADLACLRRTYDFAIPQVGANFRPRSVAQIDKGSHWFIKENVPGVRDRFEQLDFSFLDGMNTAHKSLSKKDIIAAYENTLNCRDESL